MIVISAADLLDWITKQEKMVNEQLSICSCVSTQDKVFQAKILVLKVWRGKVTFIFKNERLLTAESSIHQGFW